METAIKAEKAACEGEERRFAPHCILATKDLIQGNLHLRYPILAQVWAQRARSIAFLRGPRNYQFSVLVNELNHMGSSVAGGALH